MNLYEITESNASCVAELMSGIKPEWWNYEGAVSQLQDVKILAHLQGWYLGDCAEKPLGWGLCLQALSQTATAKTATALL